MLGSLRVEPATQLYTCVLGFNSSPQACIASPLPTEPSPKSSSYLNVRAKAWSLSLSLQVLHFLAAERQRNSCRAFKEALSKLTATSVWSQRMPTFPEQLRKCCRGPLSDAEDAPVGVLACTKVPGRQRAELACDVESGAFLVRYSLGS